MIPTNPAVIKVAATTDYYYTNNSNSTQFLNMSEGPDGQISWRNFGIPSKSPIDASCSGNHRVH